MSKNVVVPDRPQTIWRMRVAYWISKATRAQAHARARVPTPTYTHTYALISASATPLPQTHTEMCNTYCVPRQQWFPGTRLNVTLYVYCVSCFYLVEPFLRSLINQLLHVQGGSNMTGTICV